MHLYCEVQKLTEDSRLTRLGWVSRARLHATQAIPALCTCLLLLVVSLPAPAAGEPYRVGIVLPGDQWAAGVDGLKEGMKSLGYVEGTSSC